MDIEILDSYPTIEILGKYGTLQKCPEFCIQTLVQFDTFRRRTIDALRNPVTSERLLLNCGQKSSLVILLLFSFLKIKYIS
jgi:hypothetical protein